MSIAALRDAYKAQLDTALGAVAGQPNTDRLGISLALATAIDPYLSTATTASPSTAGAVKTDVAVADPIVYLKASVDTLLAAKSDVGHTHTFASLTSKPTTLAGYGITDAAPLVHTHTFASLTSKPTTLAGYGITDAAALVHTHAFSDIVSGLPTTLAGYGITDAYTKTTSDGRYAPLVHTHNASDVVAGTLADARLSANVPLKNAANIFSAAQQVTVATAATAAWQAAISGKAGQSFVLNADGKMLWGTGDAAVDTNFYRSGVGALKTDGALEVVGALTKGGVAVSLAGHTHTFASLTGLPTTIAGYGITDAFTQAAADARYAALAHTHAATDIVSGTLADARLSSNVPLKNTANSFTATQSVLAATGSTAYAAQFPADTQPRWLVSVDGILRWGPGGATAVDANLYRVSAGALKTDSALDVAGALTKGGVAVSLAGHTHTFASLTGIPTTVAGYGITDVYDKTTADGRYAPIVHTHAFSALTGIPTTVAGYGITDVYTKTTSDGRYAAISHTHAIADLTATGTRDATTYLRGDGTWATIAASGISQTTADGRYVQLAGSYADPAWITSLSGAKISGAVATATAVAWAGITGKPTTRDGYGITDVPKVDGTSATGTWAINISGNAATASTSVYLTTNDIRTISPSSGAVRSVMFGFTSWANNNTAPYADYLLFRGYGDATGGQDNILMLRKDGTLGLRVGTQAFGSATAFSTFKDVAWTDGTNATGTWGIGITGTASGITGRGAFNQDLGTGNNVAFNQVTSSTAVYSGGNATYYMNGTTWNGSIIYSDNWFRAVGSTGLLWNSYGGHFYRTEAQYQKVSFNNATAGGIAVYRDYETSLQGYVYYDSTGFGLASNTGNWGVRVGFGGGTSPGGTLYGAWTTSGDHFANNYYTNSSRSFKRDITPFSVSGLDLVNSVGVVSYRLHSDPNTDRVGFVAEETHPLFSGRSRRHFDYGNSIGLLLKAVQELSARNTSLEARIASVETRA